MQGSGLPSHSRDGTGDGSPLQSTRGSWSLAAVVLGWSALVFAGAGMDFGRNPVAQQLRGPVGALIATMVLTGLACFAILDGSTRRALSTWPGRLLIGGTAGIAVWSALSICWASGPDLAWIETNHALLGLAALLVGVGFGARGGQRRSSPAELAALVSIGCAAPIAWALATKVFPDLPGATNAARLSGGVGLPNVFALIAVIAIPGAIWLGTSAGSGQIPAWGGRAAAVGIALSLCALVLSYSRSGFVSLAVALVVVLAFGTETERALGILGAGVIGALPAATYGLGAHALSNDNIALGERRGAGLVLGLLLLTGVGLTWFLCRPLVAWLARCSSRWIRAARRGVAGVLAAGVVVSVAAVLMSSGSDRSIGNSPGRILSMSTNNRTAWWSEALDGFEHAPLVGHGAGSFRFTHLRQNAFLDVLEPHQLTLQTATELGIVGILLLGVGVAGVVLAAVAAVPRRGAAATVPALAVLAAIATHTQLDVAWSAPAIFIAALGIAGAFVGSTLPARRSARSGASMTVGLPLAAAVVVASAALPLGSLIALDGASRALNAGHPASAYSQARLAASLNPLDVRSVIMSATAARLSGDGGGRLAAARRAVERQPENPAAWACLADVPRTTNEARLAAANLSAMLAGLSPERARGRASC